MNISMSMIEKEAANANISGDGSSILPPTNNGQNKKQLVRNYSSQQQQSSSSWSNKRIHLSDVIGHFGYFQFYVTLFSALRETIVGFDVVIMSSLLSKMHKLNPNCCNLLYNSSSPFLNNTSLNSTIISTTTSPLPNNKIFNATLYAECSAINENSLISKWDMQCKEKTDWYIAIIETSYLVGFIPGNLIIGYCSDRFGRTRTYLISHFIALIGGIGSYCFANYWLFVISRFITAAGACGFNIIYTISLELVGIKYRAMNTLANHFGWGLGVVMIPFIDKLFNSDFRIILAVSPIVNFVMLIWALYLLPESPLWLMSNENYSDGRKVLKNIVKSNSYYDKKLEEENIDHFEAQMRRDNLKKDGRGGRGSDQLASEQITDPEGNLKPIDYNQISPSTSSASLYSSNQKHVMLFSNPTFRRDTIILAYSGFVSALFYYVLAMNFSYVQNLTPEANFISTGAGEWIGVLICVILLKCSTRKLCFTISFISLLISFILQYYLDLESIDDTILVTITNATGSIFTCSLIFLIVMVSMEVLPTNLRNTGSSVIDTTTHVGSAMAPLFIQIGRIIGNDKTDLIYACLSLIGVIAIQFLTKTDHIELSDV